MESKLTALLALILFICLTLVGLMLRYALGIEFSMRDYFQYLLLLVIAVLILGKPLVKIGLDLIRVGYHDSEEHFPVPGAKLPAEVAPQPKPAPGVGGAGTVKKNSGG